METINSALVGLKNARGVAEIIKEYLCYPPTS
jgi:hypothetical protein